MTVRLYDAQLNGVKFYVQRNGTEGGRRLADFELVQTDRRQIQDLGKFLRIYSIVGYIPYNPAQGVDYYKSRNALLTVLEQDGVKTLRHPFYGEVKVKTGHYTLNEETNALGKAKIEFKAFTVSEKINVPLPDAGKNPTKGGVKSEVSKAMDKIAKRNSDLFKILKEIQDTYNEAKSKFLAALRSLRQYLGPLFEDANALASFLREIENDIGFINDLLKNPDAFFNEVSNLISGVDGAYTNAQGALAGLGKLTSFSQTIKNPPVLTPTFKTERLATNASAISDSVGHSAIAMQYSAATDIEYQTTEDVSRVRQSLEKVTPATGEAAVIFGPLKSAMSDYLDNVEKTVKTIRTIKLTGIDLPLSVLCYKVYGNLDNFEILKSINAIEDVEHVSGYVKVVSGA